MQIVARNSAVKNDGIATMLHVNRMDNGAPLIWGLIDDRPGTAGQVRGVLEHLGLPYRVKRFSYTLAAHFPNRLRSTMLSNTLEIVAQLEQNQKYFIASVAQH